MDLGSVVAAVVRPGAVLGVRDERTAFTLRLLGPLLDGRASPAEVSPDFMREVRAAGGDAQAILVIPAGPGPARVEINGRQYPIPAVLREALVAALPAPTRTGAAEPAGMPPASQPMPVSQDARVALQLPTQALVAPADQRGAATTAAAANLLAASGTLRAARNEAASEPAHPATFDAPVFDPRQPAATPERIAARIGGSGAFFEAHVAQWVRGERSAESVRAEAADLARAAARDPARAEARGALQVETLQRQAIALAGPAWQGQPMRLELGRDPHALRDAAGDGRAAPIDPMFVARVRLELPHLGLVDVRLRLAGDRIAAHIEGSTPEGVRRLVEALPEFGAALGARGLRPVLLQAVHEGAVAEAAA
jgi:flagellar hook-length control protein FliK